MADIPDAEMIAGLEKMLKETKALTGVLVGLIETLKSEQTTVHPLVIEEARVFSLKLEETMSLNSLLFEAKPEATERRLRSELDDAFRAKQAVLKELQRMPPR